MRFTPSKTFGLGFKKWKRSVGGSERPGRGWLRGEETNVGLVLIGFRSGRGATFGADVLIEIAGGKDQKQALSSGCGLPAGGAKQQRRTECPELRLLRRTGGLLRRLGPESSLCVRDLPGHPSSLALLEWWSRTSTHGPILSHRHREDKRQVVRSVRSERPVSIYSCP